jgi:hypothetical protein
MPKVSVFYGIAIRMYWNERDHPIAHFHAEYDGALRVDRIQRHGTRREPSFPYDQ